VDALGSDKLPMVLGGEASKPEQKTGHLRTKQKAGSDLTADQSGDFEANAVGSAINTSK
jgi:hypothetical protein